MNQQSPPSRCHNCGSRQLRYDLENATIQNTYIQEEVDEVLRTVNNVEKVVWNVPTPCDTCTAIGITYFTYNTPSEVTNICKMCGSEETVLDIESQQITRFGSAASQHMNVYRIPANCGSCHSSGVVTVTEWG